MNSTAFHAQFFAHELTRRHPSDSLEKLTATLANAQVELNPHQVEAALFAFRSPLSMGAILADEVGLGKTIEAGLVISQKWAERKRAILLIVPANLRKQWSQEMDEKFFLPSVVLEKSAFDAEIATGNFNPFQQEDKLVLCSYQFARSKQAYIKGVNWDLAVIDEAHRLRNVWKPGNKIGKAIQSALQNVPKILLTATPLQNTLMELFGLVSLIDDHVFGDLASFRMQFGNLDSEPNFQDLKHRLRPVCKRTLRKQVQEYINYTNRIPITEDFIPTAEEQQLYDFITAYLQEEKLFALPARQRQLMTLIMRKLLASSTFAIAGTLKSLADRLENILKTANFSSESSEIEAVFGENYDDLTDFLEEQKEGTGRISNSNRPSEDEPFFDEEIEDEVDENDDDSTQNFSPAELQAIQAEVKKLRQYQLLAERILKNEKGEVLKIALQKGFEKLTELGAERKAIIFTESTRTQIYLKNLLENAGFESKTVLFNGSNADPQSRQIYKNWAKKYANTDRISGSKAVDTRAALVEFFRDEATIMIATEAAAEGINLQFCSLVVNYDLPWNPQRIEQRIGRCHRYGQKFDVVVVNFLNRANAADERVFEILAQKFQLFQGVFGVSDEVLGVIESGVDFEKRIAAIYQNCRTRAEITEAFDQLQLELQLDISEKMDDTKRQLFEHFDEEVIEKLKFNYEQSSQNLDRHDKMLWNLTRWFLQDMADFEDEKHAFSLRFNPFPAEIIHLGPYRLDKKITDDANRYRAGHPLAVRILENCKNADLPEAVLGFQYDAAVKKISVLEPFIGQSGWLQLEILKIEAFETEEYLLFAGKTDMGDALDDDFCRRLFSISATVLEKSTPLSIEKTFFESIFQQNQALILTESQKRNAVFFETELDKLDRWADDLKNSLERDLKELDRTIGQKKSEAKKSAQLELKIQLQRDVKNLERERNEKRQTLFTEQDAVEKQKELLFDRVQARLKQVCSRVRVFRVRWKLF